jgi:hypothetical protein
MQMSATIKPAAMLPGAWMPASIKHTPLLSWLINTPKASAFCFKARTSGAACALTLSVQRASAPSAVLGLSLG